MTHIETRRATGPRRLATWALGLAAAVVVLGAPAVAFAQTSGSPDPTAEPWKDARIRVGAFYFNPTFLIKNLGVDENVFNDPALPKPDLTGTLALTSEAGAHVRGVFFQLLQTTEYVWFRRFRSERSIDGNLRLMLEGRTRVIHPWIIYERVKTHSRPGLEIDTRAGRNLPLLELGADVHFGLRLGATAAYRKTSVTYIPGETFDSVDLATVLNTNENELRLLGRYQLTLYSDLTGGTEFQRQRFPLDPLRDSNSRYYYGGIETKGHAAFVGNATVGYRVQTHLDPTVPSFRGVVVKTNVTVVPTERMKLALTADRDIQDSYEILYPFYLQEGGGAKLTERISDHLDLEATAHESWLLYRQVLVGPEEKRTDTITIVGGGFGYFVGGANGTRFGLGVEHEVRTSPVALKNYTTNRILTNVKLTF